MLFKSEIMKYQLIYNKGGGGRDYSNGVYGGRAGSENDTPLPMTMTMTCDRLKFWSGPAWRSKVIIRKPWRRKNFFFFDKTIRHSRRGMPNYIEYVIGLHIMLKSR